MHRISNSQDRLQRLRLCSQRRGPGLIPGRGTRPHVPQLKSPRAAVKLGGPVCHSWDHLILICCQMTIIRTGWPRYERQTDRATEPNRGQSWTRVSRAASAQRSSGETGRSFGIHTHAPKKNQLGSQSHTTYKKEFQTDHRPGGAGGAFWGDGWMASLTQWT